MAEQDIVLKVFLEQRDGVWQALCVNFDLAAQGVTRQETLEMIEEMISTYLESLAGYSAAERRAFLNRKSPFLVRLSWAWRMFLASFLSNPSGGDKMTVLSHRLCPV